MDGFSAISLFFRDYDVYPYEGNNRKICEWESNKVRRKKLRATKVHRPVRWLERLLETMEGNSRNQMGPNETRTRINSFETKVTSIFSKVGN